MNINDFKVGQEVVVANRPVSRVDECVANPYVVVSVGKKFVKVAPLYAREQVASFYCANAQDAYFTENVSYGRGNMLFASESDFKNWRELNELNAWFDWNFRYGWSDFTLEQLRAAKRCLESENIE